MNVYIVTRGYCLPSRAVVVAKNGKAALKTSNLTYGFASNGAAWRISLNRTRVVEKLILRGEPEAKEGF